MKIQRQPTYKGNLKSNPNSQYNPIKKYNKPIKPQQDRYIQSKHHTNTIYSYIIHALNEKYQYNTP